MLCQKLLAIIQDGFPLVERPYLRLAEMLNVSEQEVFDSVEKMRVSGVIRRIGGVYDSKKLGFISRLCAGMVPASEKDFSVEPHEQTAMEKFAAAVNDELAITHNYIRSHKYNVWFTVIAENESEILTIVDKICAVTELRDVHVLTATKKYKINTVMGAKAPVDCDCKKNDDATKNVIASHTCSERQRGRLARQSTAGVLTEADKSRIRTVCDDIPHTLTPFKDWGVSCDELCEDIEAKRMRRFGAILRHQDAGFPCNAMVCFRLNEELFADSRHSDNPALRHSDNRRLEESSKILDLAKKHFISHCYERPTFEGFPYNVYAMMHSQTPEELDGYINESAALLGNPEYVVLHSLKELKKTSFKFFA